jgi:hypothetical protein
MAEIINAFGRKAGDPLPESEAVEIKPCAASVILLKELTRLVESGDVRNLCAIGVADGRPVSAFGIQTQEFVDLALLSVAADSLKERLRDIIGRFGTAVQTIEDGDDDMYDGDEDQPS